MDTFDHVTTRTTWRRFMSVVILTALIIGSVLIIDQLRSTAPRALWPKSDVVTLTGYGRLSAMNPSSDPTSVILNRSQALALDQELASLRVGRLPDCHENSVVFRLAIAPRQDDVPNWTVVDWLCPLPGTIYVKSAIGIQTYLASVCEVGVLVSSDLPRGKANGTRSAFRLCSQ